MVGSASFRNSHPTTYITKFCPLPRALGPKKIGNWLPEVGLRCFAHKPSIHQLLPIGKIAQALQPESDKELLRCDEGIGRPAPRGAWPGPDQVARMQSSDQVAADVLAENILQAIARDRLLVGNGSQHCDVELAQVQQLISNVCRCADRGGVGATRPKHPSPGNLRDLERTPVQVGGE